MSGKPPVLWLREVSNDDVAIVGGKNASLGLLVGSCMSLVAGVSWGFSSSSVRLFGVLGTLFFGGMPFLQHVAVRGL